MKQKTIKVVSVPVGKKAFVKEIPSGLKSLQTEVGGYIQTIYPFEDEVALICNEDGKLLKLPLNRALFTMGVSGREIYDIVAGDFIIAYAPIESENFESMPKELLEKYLELYKYPEKFLVKQQTIFICRDR